MKKTYMTIRDEKRYEILEKLLSGKLSNTEASEIIGVGIRQIQRIKKRVNEKGFEGVIHGNRGRRSNRKISDKERAKIVSLIHDKYYDFHPTHVSEKLKEKYHIVRDPKTIRTIMIEEGYWKVRKKKKNQEYRSWRQRKAHYGEMQQFDGSYEYWLEDRYNGKLCLLLSVDDATGALTHGTFVHDESFVAVSEFWQEYTQKHGKPMSIYMDKFSTYRMNHSIAKENTDTKTQFGKILDTLQIEAIFAHSPQAKGRVEVRFHTLQNRLIKEMRLKNITTIEEANRFLQEEFIPAFNQKYAKEPRLSANLHIPLTKKETMNLPSIFSRKEQRSVQNDFTIIYKTQWYQITKNQSVTIQKKDLVTIEEYSDKSIKAKLRGKYINIIPISKYTKKSLKSSLWIIHAC